MPIVVDETLPLATNRILNSLSPEALAGLKPHLEQVCLKSGEVLHEAGGKIGHVYFPAGAMISLVAHTMDGRSAEVGMIGSEGASGVNVLLGSDTTINEHVVRLPGSAWRVRAEAMKQQFENCCELRGKMLEFVHLMAVQFSQTALCNRLFPIEKRLARWLLMCHDRSDSDVLRLTQQSIGMVLGSSRVRITLAAIHLQELGLIKYGRARIEITDRPGLEAFTCACYQTIKAEYDKHFNTGPPAIAPAQGKY